MSRFDWVRVKSTEIFIFINVDCQCEFAAMFVATGHTKWRILESKLIYILFLLVITTDVSNFFVPVNSL